LIPQTTIQVRKAAEVATPWAPGSSWKKRFPKERRSQTMRAFRRVPVPPTTPKWMIRVTSFLGMAGRRLEGWVRFDTRGRMAKKGSIGKRMDGEIWIEYA
jgi:hypothetical protein